MPLSAPALDEPVTGSETPTMSAHPARSASHAATGRNAQDAQPQGQHHTATLLSPHSMQVLLLVLLAISIVLSLTKTNVGQGISAFSRILFP